MNLLIKKRFINVILLLLICSLFVCVGCSKDKKSSSKETQTEKETKDTRYLQEYYNLITKYENKYGTPTLDEESDYLIKGLCYAKLIDFNNDGMEELVLGYGESKDTYIEYSYEVWTYKNDILLKISSGKPIVEDGNCSTIVISSFQETKYLVSSYGGSSCMGFEFCSYDGEKWIKGFKIQSGYSGDNKIQEINGADVSEDDYIKFTTSRGLHSESTNLYTVSENKENAINKCRNLVEQTKTCCLNNAENKESKTQKQALEIADYFEEYETIIDMLNMDQTDSCEISENSVGYSFGDFYLESDSTKYHLKNSANNDIALHGIIPGKSYGNIDEIMEDNGWSEFYTFEKIHEYIQIYDDEEYFAEIEMDYDGKVISWHLYNYSPSESLNEIYKQLRLDTMSDWKKCYYEYLTKQEINNEDVDNLEVCFVYIDNNDVPEMFINNSTVDTELEICYISDDEIKTETLSLYGLQYIEKKGLLLERGGNMDSFYDIIYRLKNGEKKVIAQGSYGAADNSQLEFDEEGAPIYEYYWNEQPVSQSQYERNLNRKFNQSLSKMFDEDMMSIPEAKEEIINM